MSLSDFDIVIKQVAPLTEVISLHLMGEPLTHPNFNKIIELCEPFGTKVQLTTNGIEIKKFKESILSSTSIKQVNFSLQCFKDNFPDQDIKKYLQDILDFVVLANDLRPQMYINLRLWNIGCEANDNEKILKFIEGYLNITIKRGVEVSHIKTKKIWNKVSLAFDSRFEWPSISAPYNGEKGFCYGLKSHIGILVDGTVVPCCLDKDGQMPLGNILQTSLSSILKAPRVVRIREGFDKGILVEVLCQHCSFIKRFSK